MPRREKTEYYYTCGHCAMTDTSMPLHISTIGDYDESLCLNGPGWALLLHGPGWALLLHGDEWFCSVTCFLEWLRGKINEVMGSAEDLMDCDGIDPEPFEGPWT